VPAGCGILLSKSVVFFMVKSYAHRNAVVEETKIRAMLAVEVLPARNIGVVGAGRYIWK
jgi:hypothetical protein